MYSQTRSLHQINCHWRHGQLMGTQSTCTLTTWNAVSFNCCHFFALLPNSWDQEANIVPQFWIQTVYWSSKKWCHVEDTEKDAKSLVFGGLGELFILSHEKYWPLCSEHNKQMANAIRRKFPRQCCEHNVILSPTSLDKTNFFILNPLI